MVILSSATLAVRLGLVLASLLRGLLVGCSILLVMGRLMLSNLMVCLNVQAIRPNFPTWLSSLLLVRSLVILSIVICRQSMITTKEVSKMKYRAKVTKRGSKRLFAKTAVKVHRKNLAKPMRGGERL